MITKHKKIIFIVVITFCIAANIISCSNENNSEKQLVPLDEKPFNIEKLSNLNIDLDEAAGKDLCMKYCITCHSVQYIDMQPAFPQETWNKIVDKMVNTFGAPIPDSSVKPIIKYLMRIKGSDGC